MLRFKLQDYLSENGQSPFNDWLTGLRDLQARARVRTRLDRARLSGVFQPGRRKRNAAFIWWHKRHSKAGYSNRQGLLGRLQEAGKWQLAEITKTA